MRGAARILIRVHGGLAKTQYTHFTNTQASSLNPPIISKIPLLLLPQIQPSNLLMIKHLTGITLIHLFPHNQNIPLSAIPRALSQSAQEVNEPPPLSPVANSSRPSPSWVQDQPRFCLKTPASDGAYFTKYTQIIIQSVLIYTKVQIINCVVPNVLTLYGRVIP